MGFTILTDTSCNLPQELVDAYGLAMIPLRYFMDGQEYASYTDGKQADFQSFYEQMRAGKVVTTTLASQAEAAAVAEACARAGQDLLYIGFSSGLSGTYEACAAAVREVAERYPERTMLCVDSLAASAGQGLLITYVAKMRAEGASLEECHAWAVEHRLNICHLFTVDDLMFLKRGGRLSAVSAIFGTALAIKPVMHVDEEGKLKVLSKVRGRHKAIVALADHFGAALACKPASEQVVYISHGDCADDACELAALLKERYGIADPLITYIDPVIGAHSGPGTLALFYYDNVENR